MASYSQRILQLTLSVLCLWAVYVQGDLKCDSGWTLYNRGESCVKLFKYNTKTFTEARKACQVYNADLIRIDDQNKQAFFTDIYKGVYTTVWLGIHRTKMYAKTWHWLDDKSTIKYSNWNRGEPNNSGSHEDCVTTWGGSVKWNDIGCTKKFAYYCEKPALHTAPRTCPPGWTLYQQNCFRMFKQTKTWHDARSLCMSISADLVAIPDAGTTTFINNNFAKGNIDLWTGLNDMKKNGDYHWAKGNTKLGTYRHWAPGQPDNKNKRCVHMWSAASHKWDDADCMAKYSVLCEKPAENVDLQCPYGWDLYYKDKTCVYMWSTVTVAWDVARRSCLSMKGDLVKIADDAKNNYIQKRIGSLSRTYWIGLHKNANSDKITWLDEVIRPTYSKISANSWRRDTGYCGTVKANDKTWGKDACTKVRHYVFCERRAYAAVECPASYTTYKTIYSCLKFSSQSLNWEGARQFCKKDGGDLVTDNTYYVNKYISDMAKKTKQAYWIGLHDRKKDNHFQWLDNKNELRGYKIWGKDQPSDTQGTKNCVQVKDGMWYDDDCSVKRNFVCQNRASIRGWTPTGPPTTLICPDGWSKMGKGSTFTCVKYNMDKKTWSDARKACQKTGGDLVKIDNNDKTSYINALLLSKKANVEPYIGLNDLKNYGTYVWLDEKQKAMFANWHVPSEPSGGNEHCAVIIVDTTADYENEWNDVQCSSLKGYICEQPATVPGSMNCGPGWEDSPDTDYCYRINKDTLSWYDARTSCKNFGGDLVSVTTSEEMLYLEGRMHYVAGTDVWSGGNELTTGSGWQWTDTKPFSFFNWEAGEPKTNHSDSCISFSKSTGKWTADYCNTRLPSICKKLGNVITNPTPTAVVSPTNLPKDKVWGCPPNWSIYRGSCYTGYVNKGGVTWPEANLHCHKQSAHLVSIADANENRAVFSILPRGFQFLWIGLNDFKRRYSFSWSDNSSPMTYTNWNQDEPSLKGMPKVCVGMWEETGTWVDFSCDDLMNYFICKKKTEVQDKSTYEAYKGCKNGDKGYFNKCYRFYGTDNKPFDGAQKVCKTIGGNLATLSDRYVQAFVSSEMVQTTYWIGLSNTIETATPYKKKAYPYTWQSGAAYDYANWDRTHTGLEEKKCVAIKDSKSLGGMWHNYECNQALHYVCEYNRPGYTTPVPMTTTTPHVPCPNGWIEVGPMCYKSFKDQKLSWMDANTYCQNQVTSRGSLASIPTADVAKALGEGLRDGWNTQTVWIGLHDRDGEGGFKWVGGDSFTYQNWGNGEPNNYKNIEDCVQWQIGKYTDIWNDFNCYGASYFVCQAPRGVQPITTLTPPTGASTTKCGKGTWALYNGYCYSMNPQNHYYGKDWYQARDDCHKQGARLASIADTKENGFLTTLLGKNNAKVAWIGLNDFDENIYKWTDGTLVTFFAWGSGEPNDEDGGERCVTIDTAGRWNDLRCTTANRHYICKKRPWNFHTITNPTVTPPAGGCPANFYGTSGTSRCYRVMGVKKQDRQTITGAIKTCKSSVHNMKGRLASLHSLVDEEFVTTLIANLQVPVWIGLDGRRAYGMKEDYFWVDNTQTDYVNWGPMKQYDWRKKCTDMMVVPKLAGDWSDGDCYTYRPFVCEYDKSPMFGTKAPVTTDCPSDYVRYKEACYKYILTQQNWTQSEAVCRKDGGHLATELGGFDMAYIDLFLQNSGVDQVWIGLSDIAGKNAFTWADNAPVLYTPWDKYQPDLSLGCVAHWQGGKWRTNDCQLEQASVCQIDLSGGSYFTPKIPGKCPSNIWTLYGEHCYFLEIEGEKSWPEASYQCTMLNGQLASAHDSNDAKAIAMFLTQDKVDAWIGMHRNSRDSSFAWSDNSGLDYFNWAAGSPAVYLTNGTRDEDSPDCVIAQGMDGKWTDTSCFENHAFLCKVKQIPILTTPASTTSTTTTTTMSTRPTKPTTEACKPNPCVHGRCSDVNGAFLCNCEPGWKGLKCDTENACKPNPCVHGRCSDVNGAFLCNCRPGWKGLKCDTVKAMTTKTPGGGGGLQTPGASQKSHVTHFPVLKPGHAQQTSDDKSNSSGLSSGAIAGVVIGVLCAIAILVVAGFLFKRRQLNSNGGESGGALGFDNAAYDASRGGIAFTPGKSTN